MKRFFAVLTVGMILFSFAACGSNDSTEQTATIDTLPPTSADEPPVTTTAAAETSPSTTADEPPVTTTTAAEAAEEIDLSALELIGYQIDDGEICVDLDSWQECEDFDLFREYFFGTWEYAEKKGINSLFVIDDSEKATLSSHWHFGGFYKIGENVLLFKVSGQVEVTLFWLDIGNPDRMYQEYAEGYARNQLVFREFQRENDHKTAVLTKTDTPPNEPAENFLSIYKLYEMSRDYGIDLDLLMNMEREANIEYEGKEITTLLCHDDWYQFFPVYLVSEAPDRLELKTRVGNLVFKNLEIGVRYTLEKVGGEWVRTVEYDDEALTALSVIRYQIDDRWNVRFDTDRWEYSEDYDLFREYFFGTWEYAEKKGNASFFVIDDSEKANLWHYGGLFKIGENVLAFTMWASAEGRLFWLDRNEPGRMYGEACEGGGTLFEFWREGHKPAVLTKTDAPPNEPENNYLSEVRLCELSRDHGIDIFEMIYIHCETDVEKDGKKTTAHLDASYYDKYLVSEAPEKVVLKTQVGNPYENLEIDAWCTFEKIDGEWVRTVEFDGDVRLR